METISNKQTELETFIAEGYKQALSEERRRYCFLVDRQCAVAKNSSAYHGKVSHSATSLYTVQYTFVWGEKNQNLSCVGTYQ